MAEIPVSIKVDAPGALPTIAGVEAALAKVEAKGPAVGAALSQGLGAGAPAADKTKQSTDSVTEALAKMANAGAAFTGLADQFKREGDMLDKIHGPAKKYADDLQALDGLLMRGAISTDEYAAQVTKMNAAIDGTPGKMEEAGGAANKLGEAFEALKLPALGAGILEIGHKFAELVEQADRLQDSYTEVTNKTLKFADSNHTASQILAEQQGLSVKLNSTIGPTIELYDRVRIGSDNLRISHEEQIRMTQTLGETVQMANKPMEAAGEIMQRFAFAMESGVTDVRSVKQVMLEVPEAAKIWQETFHMTDQQILTAVRSGKLGARELAMAWAQNGEVIKKIDEDFAKRQKLNEQAAKEFAEQVKTNYFGHDMTGAAAATAANLGANSTFAKVQDQGFGGLGSASEDAADIERGRAAIAALNEDLKNGTGAWRAMGDAKEKALTAAVEQLAELPDKLMQSVQAANDLASAFGLMADKWATVATAPNLGLLRYQLAIAQATTKEQREAASAALDAATAEAEAGARQIKIQMDHVAAIGQAKQQLAALEVVVKQGGIAGDVARKQYESLMTTINDGRLPATIKIFDELHEPMRTWKEDVAATNELWKAGSISLGDYEYKLEQLGKSTPAMQHFNEVVAEQVRLYDLAAKKAQEYFEAAQHGFASPASRGEDNAIDLKTLMGNDLDSLQRQSALREQQQANRDALGDYQSSQGIDKSQAVKEAEQDKERLRVIESIQSPLAKYRDEIAQLNKDYKDGTLDVDTYTKAVAKLTKEQYNAFEGKATDAISGMDRGLKEITNTTLNLGATITQSVTGAFSKMNESIITMVTTGKADFSQLADFIEQALAKIALQEIEIGLVSSFAGGGAGVAAKVAGSWAGSDTTIPHAANGYTGKVGGVGGTDTRLFAAMVTPGESVSIRTPEQIAAEQRNASGGRNVTIVNKHDTRAELAAGLASGDHDTAIVNVLRRNSGAVQSLLKK